MSVNTKRQQFFQTKKKQTKKLRIVIVAFGGRTVTHVKSVEKTKFLENIKEKRIFTLMSAEGFLLQNCSLTLELQC